MNNKNTISLLLLNFLMCLSFCVVAQNDYQHQRVRVYGDAETLHQLSHDCFGTCGIDHRPGSYLEGDFSPFEMNKIEESGLEFEVLYKNASDYYNDRNAEVNLLKASGADCIEDSFDKYTNPSNFSLGEMSGFYTYQEILDHLDLMRELYPNLIQERSPIGDFLTHEDRYIYKTVISGEGNQDKTQVLYTSLHHAREPVSVTQMIYYMWYLLENYETDPSIQYIVDNYELYFVPCINPDGYIYNENNYLVDAAGNPNFTFWRKNKRDNNNDGVFNPNVDGVDLNRNYGYFWGLDDQGSSGNPGSEVYRGPSAFSEPETQAIKYLCEDNEFSICLNYHTHGDVLIYPWGYTLSLVTSDSAYYRGVAEAMTLENDYVSGTGNETLGYVTNGDTDDWMYGEQSTKNKIISFTPECGPAFYPAESEIIEICQRAVFMNFSAVRVNDSYGIAKESGDLFVSGGVGSLSFSLKQVGLNDGAFTVSITPLTNGVSLVNNSESTAVLENGDAEMIDFEYTIDESNLTLGESIEFEVSIDNGIYSYTQIVEKIWFSTGLEYDFSLVDSCQELNNWNNPTFDWGLTTLDFHSAPSSLSDSPSGNYLNDFQSSVIYKDTFDLSIASFAELTFWALWDIEEGFDYVQLSAVVLPDMTEIPLCGVYTSTNPDIQEPVYDGVQEDWVQERIDLTEFSGSQIQLKYEFYSDNFVNGDGFYLDDLEVNIQGAIEDTTGENNGDTTIVDTIGAVTSIENLFNPSVLSNPVPNPSNDQVYIQYQWNQLGDLPTLVMVNQLGQVVERRSLEVMEGTINLSVAEWTSGVYFYYLESENSRSSVKRLVR